MAWGKRLVAIATIIVLLGTQAQAADTIEKRIGLNPFSTAKSKTLNANQRQQVANTVTASLHKSATQIRCVGFYHSKFGASGRTFAQQRAAAACDFAKKTRSGLRTVVQVQRTTQSAFHARVSMFLKLPKGYQNPPSAAPAPTPSTISPNPATQVIPPDFVHAPYVTGSLAVDGVLRWNSRGLVGTEPIRRVVTWYVCDHLAVGPQPTIAPEAGCRAISYENDTYTLGADTLGKYIAVKTELSNSAGKAQFSLHLQTPIGPTFREKPRIVYAPTWGGGLQQGVPLTAVAGLALGEPPLSKVIEWYRCDQNHQGKQNVQEMPSDCSPVGVGSPTYMTISLDIGKFIAISEKWSNPVGSTRVTYFGPWPIEAPLGPTPTPTPTPTPEKVYVPNFIGMSRVQVQALVQRLNGQVNAFVSTELGYNYSLRCQYLQEDRVIRQFYTPGTLVRRGTTISLYSTC